MCLAPIATRPARSPASRSASDRAGLDALERVGAAAAVVFIAACFVVALIRIRYPYDLEFMGGAMLDLVEQTRSGSLYAAPSTRGMPFVYGPGWFVLMSAIARHLPAAVTTRLAARALALLCSTWTAYLVARLAKHAGASRSRVLQCVAVFACGYVVTDGWYDVERVDALAMALATTGVYSSLRRSGLVGAAFAAIALVAAVLVKQQMVLVAAGMIATQIHRRRWREASLLAFGITGALAAAVVALDRSSNGWFWVYCFELPRAHGIALRRVPYVLRDFVLGFMFVGGTTAVVLRAVRHRSIPALEGLAGPLLGAFVATVASRLHGGGWPNVTMPWLPLAAASISALPGSGPRARITALAVIAQLAVCVPGLARIVPSRAHAESEERLVAIVRTLEARGPVLVHGRGNVSATRHHHSVALQDWFRAGHLVWPELEEALARRRFAAIVLDSLDELAMDATGQLGAIVARHYYVAGRLTGLSPPPTGFAAVPRWVLLPRAEPLPPGRIRNATALREEAASVERTPWSTAADIPDDLR